MIGLIAEGDHQIINIPGRIQAAVCHAIFHGSFRRCKN